MTQATFDRAVVLEANSRFVPIRNIRRLVWAAFEAASANRPAKDADAIEEAAFDLGFHTDDP